MQRPWGWTVSGGFGWESVEGAVRSPTPFLAYFSNPHSKYPSPTQQETRCLLYGQTRKAQTQGPWPRGRWERGPMLKMERNQSLHAKWWGSIPTQPLVPLASKVSSSQESIPRRRHGGFLSLFLFCFICFVFEKCKILEKRLMDTNIWESPVKWPQPQLLTAWWSPPVSRPHSRTQGF